MSEINCNLLNTTIDKAQVMLTVCFTKNVKNLLIKTSILLVVKRKSTNFAARMV